MDGAGALGKQDQSRSATLKQMGVLLTEILAELVLDGQGVVRATVRMPAVEEVVAMEFLEARARGSQPDPEFVVLPTRQSLVYPARPRPEFPAKCGTAVYGIPLQQHFEGRHFRNHPAVLAGAEQHGIGIDYVDVARELLARPVEIVRTNPVVRVEQYDELAFQRGDSPVS